jgi:MYXO-CTERM domain-containing protein
VSEHTIDFVEPVEFASPLAAPEVGSPVRRGGDVTGSDYLPVRQPLSDLEASLGFKMRVTKDGRMLGRQPLDTTEVPISRCSDDGMLAEVSLKVEILSPVGDVVAEGLETLVSYDCAELEIIMTGPNAGPDGGSTPAADGGVGGAEAPARSGCSVGVNGGESTGLGFWALLGAVMLGRRQRSRA